MPALTIFQYDAQVPASWQWNAGVQRTLPWAMVADISYVGNRGTQPDRQLQPERRRHRRRVPGDRTRTRRWPARAPCRGATAYSENLLKPYHGLGNINQNTTDFWDEYHSLQTSLNRRFRNGFSLGLNYTYGISFKGNTGLIKRLDHASDGTVTLRADQEQYETLLETLDRRPHTIKANGVWSLPRAPESFGRVVGFILNDWQLAGVLTAGSGSDLRSGLQLPEQRRQREPDRLAELRREDPLRRRSGQRVLRQPVRASSTWPRSPDRSPAALVSSPDGTSSVAAPTSGSICRCSRDIRLGGARRMEFRVDVFNAFNAVMIDQRNSTVTYVSPSNLTVVNNQFNADGTLNTARAKPNNSGFGAATRAQAMRNVQVQLRFQF